MMEGTSSSRSPEPLIFYREGGLQGFGARCPSYQAVRWTERGDQVVFSHPEGTAASGIWMR